MAARGRFIPKNPGKYLGDPNRIFFRSSWEIRVMKEFDTNPSVYKWGSEEIKIPYIKPTDNRVHHYYPDFLVVYKDSNGEVIKEIVEVKPLKETVLTAKSSMYDKMQIVINEAKWDAAAAFAASHGMRFRVLTEVSIFGGKMNKTKKTKPSKPTIGTKGTVKSKGSK